MIALLLILVSALFSYLVTSYSFPSFGLTATFLILAYLVWKFKSNHDLYDFTYLVFAVFFSVAISVWSNGLMQFLNTISVFYFGSLLILNQNERKLVDVFYLGTLPFRLLGRAFINKNNFGVNWQQLNNSKKNNILKSQEIIISILISAGILIFVLPLLSSANPIFAKWVNTFFSVFNLTKFISNLFGYNFPMYFFRGVLFCLFAFLLPRVLTYVKENIKFDNQPNNINLPLFIPKLILAFVLFVFFISQTQMYFASAETLKIMGVTHSQFAREVFGQLSVVTLIIFGLVYVDTNRSKNSKLLTYLLVAEGLFLSFIALKSVYNYSYNFGFTEKRLWGYSAVLWTWGVYGLFMQSFLKKINKNILLRNLVIFTGVMLALVNIFNFDYLIYHVFGARTQQGVDYVYLSTLSSSSYSYHELLQITKNKYKNGEQKETRLLLDHLLWRVQSLNYKYKKLDLRTLNISEYRQYLKIKNINVDAYFKMQETLPPVPYQVPATNTSNEIKID